MQLDCIFWRTFFVPVIIIIICFDVIHYVHLHMYIRVQTHIQMESMQYKKNDSLDVTGLCTSTLYKRFQLLDNGSPITAAFITQHIMLNT